MVSFAARPEWTRYSRMDGAPTRRVVSHASADFVVNARMKAVL